MTIRAVAFDLWETLITDTADLSRRQEGLRLTRLEEELARAGRPHAAERIEHAHRALWRRCHELYWAHDRDIPCRVQIEHFLEGLELSAESFDEADLVALEHAYATAAVEILPQLVPAASETMASLRSSGYRIGMISNTGRTPGTALREILARLGVAGSIDAMVFSNEHGQCKPRVSIFRQLEEGLGIAARDIVFVGDNLYADVHGAQAAGMRGVHFTPASKGTAVAPPVDHGREITPDATIDDLAELPALLESSGW